MTSYDRIVAAFADRDPVPVGEGVSVRCPGPNHRRGDQNRSLKIDYDPAGGKTLMRCHGYPSCDPKDILAAKGLTIGDLFDEPKKARPVTPTQTRVFPYRDEQGHVLYEVHRQDLGPKQKRVWQQKPGGGSLNGVRRVLYHLPELVATPGRIVFVVEGEPKVDALAQRGFLAVCNAMGAGKWQPEYSECLRDRAVVILPDNDKPGYEHAALVANSLHGIARSVRICVLPGLPPSGDIVNWFDLGGTVDDLKRLALAAPLAADFVPPVLDKPDDGFTTLGDLLTEPDEKVSYIVDNLCPYAGVVVINAKPKVGKTTFARQMALAAARGTPFLGRTTSACSVLMLAHEEKRGEVRAAFQRMGATNEPIYVWTKPAPEEALPWLADAITRYRPGLIIIDTLIRFLRIKDVNNYSEVAAAMEPVVNAARETGACIVLCHHANKYGEGSDAILGSTAIFGNVDTAIHLNKDPDGVRTVWTEQRYGTDMPKTVLKLDPATDTVRLAGELEWVQMVECAEAIIDTLPKEGMAITELEKAVGKRALTFNRAFKELRKRGWVVSEKRSGATYYKVSPIPLPRPLFEEPRE